MLAYEEMISNKPTQQDEMVFEGFTLPTEDYFAPLHYWRLIGVHITSLAEYKIIDYILQVTWGTGNPYNRVPLTIESLMDGYIDDEGIQIDNGTGLSRQSVITGLDKAIKHGLIERHIEYWVDEDRRTRTTRYYGLHFYEPVEVNDLDSANYPQEDAVDMLDELLIEEGQVNDLDFGDNQPVEPFEGENLNCRLYSNNSNNIHSNITCSNLIRIQSQETLPEKVYSNKTHQAKENYPAFIRAVLKYLSVELGDGEHIAPNIAQAARLYKQSGMSEEAFTKLLYDLEAVARNKRGIKRVNSQGWPNRMPYFFKCLRNLLITSKQSPCNAI